MMIATARLALRDLAPDDLDDLAAMFDDEEVMRWIGGGGVLGRDVAEGMIERQRRHYAERGWGQWGTVERATGRMIGVCGLIPWPSMGGREELEVAYLLARDAWGKGFVTEAALAIRDFGVTIRPDLVSLIYPENVASINVARKLGMAWEKEVELWRHCSGVEMNCVAIGEVNDACKACACFRRFAAVDECQCLHQSPSLSAKSPKL